MNHFQDRQAESTLIPAETPAPQLVSNLEREGEDSFASSADSTYAGSLSGSTTTSLKSSITKYLEENGRTYHSYGSTEHWGPNDAQAQYQQDLAHQLWRLALKGEYYIAPMKNPQCILDIGTGTGIWAIEVAEQHPQAVVHGIDLSPIQPTWLPTNAQFVVDDYNADWIDVEKYDLIHARELLGTVPDWVALYKKALVALKPGGWFDQAEPSLFFHTDHEELTDDHPYTQWGNMMTEAGNRAGMRFDIGPHIKEWMEEAGFINVREDRQPWTIGGWSKGRHEREIGQWNQVRLDEGVKDFCSRRFTNQMGWKPEEIEAFCGRLRSAFRRKRVYGYQWVLSWRAYCVIQTPNEVLVDKLGLDIPPPPIVTLEEIASKEIQISWKSPDAGALILEHHVEVNGRLVGITRKHETAAVISNLKPKTTYDIRIFNVSNGHFQTPSTPIFVKTTAPTNDEPNGVRNESGPQVRALAPRPPPTPSTMSAPVMAREPSGGPIGRRGTTGRRSSPAGNAIEGSGQQPETSGKTGEEDTDDSLAELSQRFQKIQQDIEATETQIQDEEKEFDQQVKELEAKRDELKQMLKERDEASADLRKQVHKAEAANRTAQSEKTKKERLLEQKQNARRKRKDEVNRWDEQIATMAEEMAGIKTQQAAVERRKQSEINEVRLKIEEEQREVALLEEDNKEKALQIKALEEERKQLDAEEETEESREADRLEQERGVQWRERISDLSATYSRVLYDLQQAHHQFSIARERLAMCESQRRNTTVSFAPMAPMEQDLIRRAIKPIRRNRQAGSHGSSISSPRAGIIAEPYNANTHFSNAVNASPTTFGPSFFNFQNGMTLLVPSDNADATIDEPEAMAAAPMSPRADSLLPADLLGDESTDELVHQDEEAPPKPTSIKSHSIKEGKERSGSRSGDSSSPKSFASPREDYTQMVDTGGKSSSSPSVKEPAHDEEDDDGSRTAKKSAMSNLFSFSRQRGKTLADQPPLLGSLKSGQSQSFPRNFDDFDPNSQPRRRLSYGGNWGFPGSSLLGRGHSMREHERLSTGSRNFAGIKFGKPNIPTQTYDPFSPEQSLRGEASPSRPASVYSFDKLPRPSAESQFHAWSLDKGIRNSPLAPDWSSSVSRNHSRRPSIYGSTSNLSLGVTGDEDFLQPRRELGRPLQAPIGTRPVSSQQPATPRLNPAAPSFTMFFGKNRDKVKEKVKAKETEKEGKASETENASPPESRKSKDTHSIAATASTYESRDSLERTPSGYSGGGGTPSETPSKPTFISKITRKASANKFGSWKGQGGLFSRKDDKGTSTPTGDGDEEHPDFFARSYESMATTPIEDKDKKASRTSLGSWNFMRKSKKGNRDDLVASEVSESSEKALSEVSDEPEDEHAYVASHH